MLEAAIIGMMFTKTVAFYISTLLQYCYL